MVLNQKLLVIQHLNFVITQPLHGKKYSVVTYLDIGSLSWKEFYSEH